MKGHQRMQNYHILIIFLTMTILALGHTDHIFLCNRPERPPQNSSLSTPFPESNISPFLLDAVVSLKGGKEENQYDKPWAHLQVPEIRNLATIQKRRHILQWKNPFARKMNYTNDGSLKIMEEGNYFVYSQVTFRAHNHRKTKKCEQLVLSKTHQYPEPLTLLKGSITLEANQTDWKKTIYVGGVTRLHEGDLLMVCVNDPELVEHSGDGVTYFGAFLI